MILTLVLIALAIVAVVGLYFAIYVFYGYDHMALQGICIVIGILSAIICLALAIMWPTNYYQNKEWVVKYHAVQQTIAASRKDVQVESDIERTSILRDILQINTELAQYKYEAQTWQRPMIPDEILQLEPLK